MIMPRRTYAAMTQAERNLCLAADRFEGAVSMYNDAPDDPYVTTEVRDARHNLRLHSGNLIVDHEPKKTPK